MTVVGTSLLIFYFAAPTKQSSMSYGTVQVGWANGTDSLKVNTFTIGVAPSQNLLVVTFSAAPLKQGTDIFYVVLPVQVTSISGGAGSNWNFYNVLGYGSTLVARVPSSQLSYVWAQVYTSDDVVSGSRGDYTFFLPVGQTIPYALSTSWQRLHIPVSIQGPGVYHATESVSIPGGSTWSLVYPPTAVPSQGNYSTGAYENLVWDFDRAQPVFLRYTVGGEVALYNLAFALGGILLGAGISLIASAYSDYLRSKGINSAGNRGPEFQGNSLQ